MKKVFLFFFFFGFSIFFVFASFQPASGIDSANIKDVAISPFYPNLIYAVSARALYQSDDNGKNFKKFHSFLGEDIRSLFFNLKEAGLLYLVTSKRLYQITKGKEILFTLDDDEQQVLSAVNHDGFFYVGTTEGLYFSNQDYLNWRKVEGLRGRPVYWIEPGRKNIYLAASDGVYILGQDKKIERTFILRKTEEDESAGVILNQIKKDIFNPEKIWLATSKGLFASEDGGHNFRKFFGEGIDNLNIFSLSQTDLEKNSLYLASQRGFFRLNLKEKKTRGLYAGLYATEVRKAKFNEKGKIYLATDKGVFTNQYFTLAAQDNNWEKAWGKQPSIRFVQEKATDFNEVSPEKIREWRRAAALSPFLPNLRAKIGEGQRDRYQGSTVDPDTDRWVRYHEDFSWDVTATWNLGDLVWSSAQTSIDTRSRLNTQLRLDILESVNRVYYERLRLKKELASSSLSPEKEWNRQLRLEELTAMLDYYTGGAFSQRLRELSQKK